MPSVMNFDDAPPLPEEPDFISPEEARQEARRVMTDPAHPMHAKWQARQPEAVAYLDELYGKTYGTEPVEIR